MFGVKRIPLPKDNFGLDEDGWIDVRTRLTVRAAFRAQSVNGDQMAATKEMMAAYIVGWSIKSDGEELKFSEDTILELPAEMLAPVQEAIEAVPLARRSTPVPS